MKTRLSLIIIGLALILTQNIAAQEQQSVPDVPRHYIQLNIGDPLFNMLYSGSEQCYPYGYDYDRWFKPDVYDAAYSLLPTFSLSYYYAVKPWLHVGGEIYFSGEYSVVRDRISDKYRGISGNTGLSISPAIRFPYWNKRYVGLYSGLSLGLYIGMAQGAGLYDPNKSDFVYVLPAFQVTALGVRVGNKVYGIAEIGIGNKGIVTIGIGARF